MNDTRERLSNTSNPWQGSAKRVLCVCSAGLLRSPTAANVIHQHWGHNTRSCGTSSFYALIVVDEVLLTWAQEVVCMDRGQESVLQAHMDRMWGECRRKPIRVLDIPDNSGWNDHGLRELIKDAYEAFEEGSEDVDEDVCMDTLRPAVHP